MLAEPSRGELLAEGELQRAIAAGGAVPLAAAAGGAGGPLGLPGGLAAAAQLQAALFQAQSYGLAPQQPPPPPAAMSVAQVQTMLHMLGEQQTQVFLQAQARAQAEQQQLAQARTPQHANPQTLDWGRRLGSPTDSTWRDGPKGTSEVPHERHQAAAGVGEPRQWQTESLHQVQSSHIRARLQVQISALCSDLSLPESATRAVMAAHLSSPHGLQPRGDRGKGLSFSPASTVLAGPAGAAGGGRNDEGPLARGGGVELAAALAEVLRKQKPPSTHMLKKTGTPGRWAVRAPPVGEAMPPSTATTPGEDPPVLTRVRCDNCKVVLQMEVPRGPVKEVRMRCGSCNCLLEVELPPNFREDLKRLAESRPDGEEVAPTPAQAARRDSAPISERELEGIGTLLELAGEGASSEETTSDRPLAASRRQQAARAGARRGEGKAKKAAETKKDGSPPPRPAVRKGRSREERALARGPATAEGQPAAKKPKPAPETATKELPAKAPTERMGVGEDGGPPRAIRASPEGGGRGGRRAAGAAAPDAAAREAAAEMPNAAPEVDAGEASAEKPKAAPGTAAQESPAEQAKSAPEAAAEAPQVQDPKANREMNAGGSCPPSPPGTAAVKLKAAEAASSPAAAVAALRRPIQRALNRARPNDVGSASGNAPPAAQAQAPAHPGLPNPAPPSSDRNDAAEHHPTLTWTPEPEREAGRAPPGRKPSPKQ